MNKTELEIATIKAGCNYNNKNCKGFKCEYPSCNCSYIPETIKASLAEYERCNKEGNLK